VKIKIVPVLILITSVMETMAQNQVSRKVLSSIDIGNKEVSLVKVVEIEFPAGKTAPLHKHPCPVMGTIVFGQCLIQVEGEPAKILKAGEVFFEPADTPIVHFDNNSQTEPMKFIAYYLTNGEEDLIEMLHAKQK
jgi:quercetin dioxygenase-like cupin family protein